MLLKPGIENKEYWFMFSGIDKLLHFSIFGFLAFCFLAYFQKVKFLAFIQIMLCYALLTEILQDEMGWGRALEAWDVVADMLGVMLGYAAYHIFIKHILPYIKFLK
ncbi:VanZ family protein [Elizabethkingia sp. JS20170427COW]|uniref:VanZ family protein n=1 Tax=Elizabethkingia sp. JS20170427COW TaxID=2583851 RepID=UPI0021070E1B|nr:VanZ family protein [Elizabethkingia sp. JS20170427COW]